MRIKENKKEIEVTEIDDSKETRQQKD